MSPECNVLCIDNSEWMRNADYSPTRFHSLYDAVNALISAKARGNVETTFSVLSLTGFELLCSLTTNTSQVLRRIHSAPIRGCVDLVKGLKIAELVLEQRENKHYDKRVVAFVGSPFSTNLDELSALACKFFESSVHVDIVLFGEETSTAAQALNNFIEILNACTDPSSHLLIVPPGDSITRMLKASEIMPESQRMTTAFDDLDFDVETDPDLAEAIRLSIREASITPSPKGMDLDPIVPSQFEEAYEEPNFETMTEEEQIQWAMRMSVLQTQPAERPQPEDTPINKNKETKNDS